MQNEHNNKKSPSNTSHNTFSFTLIASCEEKNTDANFYLDHPNLNQFDSIVQLTLCDW